MMTLEIFIRDRELRNNVLKNRITTQLLGTREVLQFDNIETELTNTDITQQFETPFNILFKDEFWKKLIEVEISTGPNMQLEWLKILSITYIRGGRVYMKKKDKDSFIIKLDFD